MIDQAAEKSIAARRARLRQKKDPSHLIREDGMLYPHTELNSKKANYRPYYGDLKATLDDRLRYLKGLGAKRVVTYTAPEPFDVGMADKDALIQFAMEQYGSLLDSSKPLNTLRQEVMRLDGLPEIPILTQKQAQAPDDDYFDASAAGAVSAADYAQRLAQEGPTATSVRPPKPAALSAKRGL